jgi:hypothetical protein
LKKAIREIQSNLRAIEKDGSLYEESNFVARAEAIDLLECHIIDRIESAPQTADGMEALRALNSQAELLVQRLEKIDERLFQRLRADIRSGHCTGMDLKHRLDDYAECASNATNQGFGYDSLDMFVNGLLASATAPKETRELEPEMVPYQPTPARVLLEFVEKVELRGDDVFYDLGSGLGQVSILVNLLTGAKARGVEFEPAYCHYAQQSAKRLGLSQVEFINLDAREADYSDGTVFFMYTPFQGQLLQVVLDKLRDQARKRTSRICTYGPSVLKVSQQDWLIRLDKDTNYGQKLAIFQSRAGACLN